MKIIKKGQPPGERVHRGTCLKCRTEVEFKQKEGKVTMTSEMIFVTVACPICTTSINVNMNKF